jgi:TRAP-type C4-dicarboxylate transport system permease small subunit
MRFIRRSLDLLAGWLMVLGGCAIVLMMVQIMLEVILRTAFKITIPGTEETVSAYYMIGCAFLPLAWVQRHRAHVKVEVFTLWMSPRTAAGLDGLVYLLCAAGTGIFAYAALGKAMAMTEAREILIGSIDVVVWPSRWFVPVGLAAMMLYMILHAVDDLAWAFKGGERTPGSEAGGH